MIRAQLNDKHTYWLVLGGTIKHIYWSCKLLTNAEPGLQ